MLNKMESKEINNINGTDCYIDTATIQNEKFARLLKRIEKENEGE